MGTRIIKARFGRGATASMSLMSQQPPLRFVSDEALGGHSTRLRRDSYRKELL